MAPLKPYTVLARKSGEDVLHCLHVMAASHEDPDIHWAIKRAVIDGMADNQVAALAPDSDAQDIGYYVDHIFAGHLPDLLDGLKTEGVIDHKTVQELRPERLTG